MQNKNEQENYFQSIHPPVFLVLRQIWWYFFYCE